MSISALVIPAKTYDYVHFFVILTAERHVEESERISKPGWQVARVAQAHMNTLRTKLEELFSRQSVTQPSPPAVAPSKNTTSFIQYSPLPPLQPELAPAPAITTFFLPPRPPVANLNKSGHFSTAPATSQRSLTTSGTAASGNAAPSGSSTASRPKRPASTRDVTDEKILKKQAVAAAALRLVPLKLDLGVSSSGASSSSGIHSMSSPTPLPTALATQSPASVTSTPVGVSSVFAENMDQSLETILNNARLAILCSQDALVTQSRRHQEEKAQLLATITELRQKVEVHDVGVETEADNQRPTMEEIVALRHELQVMKAREKEMFSALEAAGREARAVLENVPAARKREERPGVRATPNLNTPHPDPQINIEANLKAHRAALLTLRSQLTATTAQTEAIKIDFEACKNELEGTKAELAQASEELKATKTDRDRAISERGEAILNLTVLQRRLDDTRAAKELAYQVQSDAVRMTGDASQEGRRLRVENSKLKEQLGALGNEWVLSRAEVSTLRKERDALQRRLKTEPLIPGVMEACQALEGIAVAALRKQAGRVNQD